MDTYDYMTNSSLYGWKLYRLPEENPQPRRKTRQRDVWKPPVSPSKGTPTYDIAVALGQTQQSKYTGESMEETIRRIRTPRKENP